MKTHFSVAENLIFEKRGPRAVTSAIVIIVVFAAAIIIVAKIIFLIIVIIAIFIIMVVIIIRWCSEHTQPVVQTDDTDSARVRVPAHARTEFAPIPLLVFADPSFFRICLGSLGPGWFQLRPRWGPRRAPRPAGLGVPTAPARGPRAHECSPGRFFS